GIIRFEIAVGKAYGALGMGWGSRTMMDRAAQNPNFLTAIVAASGGRLVPNPAGVLVRDGGGQVVGAVGVSGDTGDNDEIIADAGIEAAGLKADPGGTKK
ncbi:MAG: heme-binding protein, partial [Xanthobacteraceae bacterium]